MVRKILVVASMLVVASCGGGPSSILDEGRPRFPDAEGVATEVTLESIEIDGESYAIGEDVESFTTRSHEVTPLLTWKEKYVHLGLTDEGDVAWIAGIGTVIKEKGKDPVTLYTGVFERQDAETDRAVFEDGTTLALGRGVALPEPGETLVTLDPEEHEITKIENP
jgi:hypothetical protein